MLALFLIQLVLHSQCTSAAPSGAVDWDLSIRDPNHSNSTSILINHDTEQWFGDNNRSTWDILRDCLVTVFACTWISVHPNVRGHRSTFWMRTRQRIQLAFFAVMVPELVLGWAVRQYIGARAINRLMLERISEGKKKDKQNGREGSTKYVEWTLSHSHFLQMGGFIFEIDDTMSYIDLHYDDEGRREEAIQALTRCNETEDDIQDRSKGDLLAKSLVLAQTVWFVTQCIARAIQGLAITEVELTTLAYAFLNGAMYFCWWHKPLDVQCTIVIKLLKAHEPTPEELAQELPPAQVNSVIPVPVVPSNPDDCDGDRRGHFLLKTKVERGGDKDDGMDAKSLVPKSTTVVQRVLGAYTTVWYSHFEDRSLWIRVPVLALLSPIAMVEHAVHFVVVPIVMFAVSLLIRVMEPDSLTRPIHPASNATSMHFPTFYAYPPPQKLKEVANGASFLSASVFGAIHCLALLRLFTFPSPIHRGLWFGSAVLICAIPVAVTIGVYIVKTNRFSPVVAWTFAGHLDTDLFVLQFLIIGFFVFCIFPLVVLISMTVLIAYIPARTILLVLSIIELAHLPGTAHQSVEWSRFL